MSDIIIGSWWGCGLCYGLYVHLDGCV